MPTVIQPGLELIPGFEIDSPDNNFKLKFQKSDGNLVLYDSNNVPRWNAGTQNRNASRCVMQMDGNLVIYDFNGNALWASNTSGHPFPLDSSITHDQGLNLQDDGNVVIYRLIPLWSTMTGVLV